MRQMNVHQYFVYMLTNAWRNVIYTGVTNSLETRIWQHKNGAVDGFTKQYNCHSLVYYEIHEQISQAIEREKQIKGWSRAKKDALVASLNPKWEDLAASGMRTRLARRRGIPRRAPPLRGCAGSE